MSENVLVKVEKAKALLAQVSTATEAKRVADFARSAEMFALKQGIEEAAQYAHEIKIDAMRLMGEFLSTKPMAKGTRGQLIGRDSSGGTLAELPEDFFPTLDAQGISKKESANGRFIYQLGKASLEIFKKLRSGEKSLASVKKESKLKSYKETLKTNIEKPTGFYDVIIIDPPWPAEKILRNSRPNQICLDYPTLSLSEIQNIKLPVSRNCHVFLWATHRFLKDAFDILKTWNCRYSCTFVWHKNGGFQPVGLPQFNCEFVLYARHGTPVFVNLKSFCVCFNAPRGKHSEKPEEFYTMIRNATSGKRLDMFSRRKIDGFDSWGNEAS